MSTFREKVARAGAHGFSPTRISAMVMRHVYLLRRSWPRLLELAYWPIVQVLLWGFISKFFATNSSWVAQAAGVLLAGVLLWDVLFRSQLGVTISLLEELWSRNLGHLFVSPLRPYELCISLTTMSMIRTLIGILPAALIAIPLYEYSIFEMGLPLLAFFTTLLVFGWALGLAISAVLIRWGLAAENLAWLLVFVLAPISGIYYPVDVLPGWVQTIAWMFPAPYVFEGMREVLFHGVFRTDLMLAALGLDILYILLGAGAFLYSFRVARIQGLLLRTGE